MFASKSIKTSCTQVRIIYATKANKTPAEIYSGEKNVFIFVEKKLGFLLGSLCNLNRMERSE